MKITKRGIVIALLEAFLGFALWTVCLTPYMLGKIETPYFTFGVGCTFEQYLAWLVMQAIIVPVVAVFVVKITNRITSYVKKYLE